MRVKLASATLGAAAINGKDIIGVLNTKDGIVVQQTRMEKTTECILSDIPEVPCGLVATSMAINATGNTVVIGCAEQNIVLILTKEPRIHRLRYSVAILTPELNDTEDFGHFVAVSGDGTRLIAAASAVTNESDLVCLEAYQLTSKSRYTYDLGFSKLLSGVLEDAEIDEIASLSLNKGGNTLMIGYINHQHELLVVDIEQSVTAGVFSITLIATDARDWVAAATENSEKGIDERAIIAHDTSDKGKSLCVITGDDRSSSLYTITRHTKTKVRKPLLGGNPVLASMGSLGKSIVLMMADGAVVKLRYPTPDMVDQTSPVFPWAIASTAKIMDDVDPDCVVALSVTGANTPGELLVLWQANEHTGVSQ